MCFIIIFNLNCCIDCSELTIPMTKPNGGTVPGWNVKHGTLNMNKNNHCSGIGFGQKWVNLIIWVWSEMGKPYNGVVYDFMKRSRHTYHYSVRRVKKNKMNIQKQRLTDCLYYDNTNFWENVSCLNALASKSLPDVVNKASSWKQVSDVCVCVFF